MKKKVRPPVKKKKIIKKKIIRKKTPRERMAELEKRMKSIEFNIMECQSRIACALSNVNKCMDEVQVKMQLEGFHNQMNDIAKDMKQQINTDLHNLNYTLDEVKGFINYIELFKKKLMEIAK